MPGKLAIQEMEEDIANRLNIISSALLKSFVGVERDIESGACKLFALFKFYMSFYIMNLVLSLAMNLLQSPISYRNNVF